MKKSSSRTGTKSPANANGRSKVAKKASQSPKRGGISATKAATKAGKTPKTKSGAVGKPKTWTFLTNHSHVLIVLYRQPDMVLRQVAAEVGITERAVQRIVQDLEEDGFVRRERVGRCNHYEVIADMPLRHPIESHRNVGALLSIVGQ